DQRANQEFARAGAIRSSWGRPSFVERTKGLFHEEANALDGGRHRRSAAVLHGRKQRACGRRRRRKRRGRRRYERRRDGERRNEPAGRRRWNEHRRDFGDFRRRGGARKRRYGRRGNERWRNEHGRNERRRNEHWRSLVGWERADRRELRKRDGWNF